MEYKNISCQTNRKQFLSSDKGFNCQFESLYRNITDEKYKDFYEDFFQYSNKYYCPFHAPMESKKLSGEDSGKTKKEIFEGSHLDKKTRIPYLEKFYNVIYGVINQQSAFFSERFKRDDYEICNEEQIYFEGIVFPRSLSLTKDESGYGEERKKYSNDLSNIIPFINFSNCEFRNLVAKSGIVSNKTYPELCINGASFFNSSFDGNLQLIGVNFAIQKIHNYGVNFDEAKLNNRIIEFTGSKFIDLSLINTKINAYHIEFNNLKVRSTFDISCDYESDENIKKIKSHNRINFSESIFGDEAIYKKITANDENYNCGKFICRNRIFELDAYFQSCCFYQAPDFFGTRFERIINFEFSEFLPSSFKYTYHSFYRVIKSEMARLNLYREERNFWRYEEKCLEEPSVKLKSWKGIPINKPLSFLTKFLSKKSKNKKSEFFFTYHGFVERLISKLFEITCKRGTSFSLIIASILLLPTVVFPFIYLLSGDALWAFLEKCWSSICATEFSDLKQFFNLYLEELRKSFFYTMHPFSGDKKIIELKDYQFSAQLFISYLQSIIQIPIYVIFGFMLRKRFRMSGG